jgi:hypothetical protein
MNCLASLSDPKRSGNAGPYFNVLNSDSELFQVRNNSDYVELVIIPSGGGPADVLPGDEVVAG